jgi:hypothetical protein
MNNIFADLAGSKTQAAVCRKNKRLYFTFIPSTLSGKIFKKLNGRA